MARARPYYENDHYPPRRSSSHVHDRHADRDCSPPRSSGGSPYVSGALPPVEGGPRYDGPTPFFPPRRASSNTLQVPQPRREYQLRRSHSHSHSHSAAGSSDRSRSRRRHNDDDDDDDDDGDNDRRNHGDGRSRSPMEKARHMLQHTFTDSTSGLGVGVLGAIVGGLAAREASEAAAKHNAGGGHHHHEGTLLSTIVGAAVGGLGANALEKRFEMSRHKDRTEQEAWEKKWGRPAGYRDEDRHRDRDRERDRDRNRERDRDRNRDRDLEDGGRRSRRRSHDDHEENDHVYENRGDRRQRGDGY